MNRRTFLHNTLGVSIAAILGFQTRSSLATPLVSKANILPKGILWESIHVHFDDLPSGCAPIYDKDPNTPVFFLGEDGNDILENRTGRRVTIPLFELAYNTNPSDSMEVIANNAIESLRISLNDCITALVGTAREIDPRVNQVCIPIQVHPVAISDTQEGPVSVLFTQLGMAAYYSDSPMEKQDIIGNPWKHATKPLDDCRGQNLGIQARSALFPHYKGYTND